MSRVEEVLDICMMEGFAKRYPFLTVYSDTSFVLFRNCRGPAIRIWTSNEAIKNRTTIAIYIQSPNCFDSCRLKAQVAADKLSVQVKGGCRNNAVRHIGYGRARDLVECIGNSSVYRSNN